MQATITHKREVVAMLKDNQSHRAIARQLGIHRRSVERVANAIGHHPKSSKKQRIVQYHRGGKKPQDIAVLVDASLDFVHRVIDDFHSSKPRQVAAYKCPGCFNRVVYRPCVICEARNP
jgi:transposase-like protein